MTQQNKSINRTNAGAKVKQFQIHNRPALVETDPFDEQMSVDKIQRKKKRAHQNDDFERQYSMFQGQAKNISLSGLNHINQNKPQTCQNSAVKTMDFNQRAILEHETKSGELRKFSNHHLRPKRVSMSPDKKMLVHKHNASFDLEYEGIQDQTQYSSYRGSVKLPQIGRQDIGVHLPQLPQAYKSPQRINRQNDLSFDQEAP